MSFSHPHVSIIIVTVNTPQLTRACLESVFAHTSVSYELIVVNNSRAQAIQACLKAFRGIRVIQNPKNQGYARSANQGALVGRGNFLCFLNSDTVVPPQWLERLLKGFQEPGVGAVGPTQGRVATNGLPFTLDAAALADEAFQQWRPQKTREVECILGSCIVLPRVVVDRLGLFDERFFFGFDDLDYCLRLRLGGYRILEISSLFVYHLRGGSVQTKKCTGLWIKRSRRQFLGKWRSILKSSFWNYEAIQRFVERKIKQRKTVSINL